MNGKDEVKDIKLTKEEREMILKMLREAPMQGSMQALSAIMPKMQALINKLQDSLK